MIEIKQRTEDHGVVQVGKETAGLVEGWLKWSFEIANPPEYMKAMQAEDRWWKGIRKRRWLRRFRVSDGEEVSAVSDERLIDGGCEWELSEIQIEGIGDRWWSLAFEAFGEEADRKKVLLTVAKEVLSEGVGMALREVNSSAYPYWLAVNASRRQGSG
jgi:hypothetical protein